MFHRPLQHLLEGPNQFPALFESRLGRIRGAEVEHKLTAGKSIEVSPAHGIFKKAGRIKKSKGQQKKLGL